ncbi:MAG: hypothetical protein ACJ75Z_02110 [Solirubrobacterales bacterium]
MAEDLLYATANGRRIQVAPPRRRAHKKRKLMSEYVLQEIEACGAFFELVSVHGRTEERDFPKRSERWWIGNGLLEVFLLHVRILDEFLHADLIAALNRKRPEPIEIPNDASALDFVVDQQAWLDARPPRAEGLRWQRISKTVAHLSWARVEAGWETPDLGVRHHPHQKGQEWPTPEIWDALRGSLLAFLDHVDQAAVCDEFTVWADKALATEVVQLWPE